MTAANITSGLLSAVIFIYLARVLEPVAFGYLSYALAIVFFIANFVDLGLSTYGVREIARHKENAPEYVSRIVSFRIVVAALVTAAFFVLIWLSHKQLTLKLLLIESTIFLFAAAMATEWAFQGLEKMHMVFLSFAVTSSIQVILIYFFVKGPGDLLRVAPIYFLAIFPVVAVFLKRLKFSFTFREGPLIKAFSYMPGALAIWSISMCTQVYNNADIFLLGLMHHMDEVGYFSIARRTTGAVTLLMVFLANAVLPRLSATFHTNFNEFRQATRKFARVAILFIIFVLVPLIVFSKQVILVTVGSGYLSAKLPLQLLTIGLVMILFNMPYSTGLIASGFEREVLRQAGASAVLSIGSNLLLIPRYGMVGASISFLLAEALALGWILVVYRKRIGAII